MHAQTQTDPQNFAQHEHLESRIEELERLFRTLMDSRTPTCMAGLASSLEDLSSRVRPLGSRKEQQARLLCLKAKADEETHADIESIKKNLRVLSGRVDYCIQELKDSGNDIEEEEDDGSIDEAESESEHTDSSEVLVPNPNTSIPIPEEIQRLPWTERMAKLGYLKGPTRTSASKD